MGFTMSTSGNCVQKESSCLLVRIYNPTKTVADCFKYRNKIGLDVTLEALREVIRERNCTTDERWQYAKIRRMTKTMRPYMEAII